MLPFRPTIPVLAGLHPPPRTRLSTSDAWSTVRVACRWRSSGSPIEDRLGGLKLRFIGDGPLAPEIDRLVSPSVSRTSWLPKEDVASTLLGARALICPSRVARGWWQRL